MEQFFHSCTGQVAEWFQSATPFHYAQLALAIVVLGWYMRRFSSD